MKPIEIMHQFFGSGHPSNKCGDCKNLTVHRANRTWYKCRIYGETSSEASDWRKKWNACAMFNVPYNGMPIIEVKKHMSKILAETQRGDKDGCWSFYKGSLQGVHEEGARYRQNSVI